MFNNEKDIPPIKYVDFDGTLAYFDVWRGGCNLGPPLPFMVEKVKRWIANGVRVVIFTARVSDVITEEERERRTAAIKEWCKIHLGRELEVTGSKRFFHKVYDDRAVSIVQNTGMSREEALLKIIEDAKEIYQAPPSVLDVVVRYLENIINEQNK